MALVGGTILLAVLFAPIDNSTAKPNYEQACGSCHDVGADSLLTVTGLPAQYSPSATYTITITLDDPNGPTAGENGFYLTINGGTLSNPSADAEVNDPASSASTADSRPMRTSTWTVDWTAPSSGDVTIQVWGVAASDSDTGTNAPYDDDTFVFTVIPEFPALLLPVIGLIGAVVFAAKVSKRKSG